MFLAPLLPPKYLYGDMMCVAQSSLPMRDSILYIFIFVQARYDLVSCIQSISFSLDRNTGKEQDFMSQPR